MSSFTIENMRQGVDEDGRRIKIHTSALTSELAIKAVVGKFHYSGKKIETGKDQYRMHINNIGDGGAPRLRRVHLRLGLHLSRRVEDGPPRGLWQIHLHLRRRV